MLAPLVAACGVPVPMISGRGLGHTGGTLDKLEAIPGFDVNLDLAAYRRVLADVGTVMIGQTAEIAPADKKIYALRDVTGTVESIPLIAASILSKKLAEGIDALVLDVKAGRGAFMTDEAQARLLAETLVQMATDAGTPTVALLTDMDVPLGRAAGNGPETAEAIQILRNETPDGGACADVVEVTLALAGEMVCLGGKASTPEEGRAIAQKALADGSALAVFRRLVAAHGGDPAVVDAPETLSGTLRRDCHSGAQRVRVRHRRAADRARRVRPRRGPRPKRGRRRPESGRRAQQTARRARRGRRHARDALRLATPQGRPRRRPRGVHPRDSAPGPRPLVLDRLDAGGWRSA